MKKLHVCSLVATPLHSWNHGPWRTGSHAQLKVTALSVHSVSTVAVILTYPRRMQKNPVRQGEGIVNISRVIRPLSDSSAHDFHTRTSILRRELSLGGLGFATVRGFCQGQKLIKSLKDKSTILSQSKEHVFTLTPYVFQSQTLTGNDVDVDVFLHGSFQIEFNPLNSRDHQKSF